MKIRVRIGVTILATGLFWLFGGCAHQPASAYRSQPLNDFEVVETSTKRQLTTREMAHLRAKVADYLAQQEETGTGDFYVKIYLGEEPGLAQGEWVIVRFTRYPSALTGRLASYAEADASYLGSPPYQYDWLPFGWFGFSTLSFRYYDDPRYYSYGGYYPRWHYPRYTGGVRPRDRHHDHKPDRRPGHHGQFGRWDGNWDHWNRPPSFGGYRPPGAVKPSYRPDRDTWPRWDHRREGGDDHRWHPRRDFTRRDGVRPRFDRTPPVPTHVTVPSVTPPPVAPPRFSGRRPHGPGEAPASVGTRIEPPRQAPGGRQRHVPPPTAANREARDEARVQESARPERTERTTYQEPRREAPAVHRPMLQDGGRRAREP